MFKRGVFILVSICLLFVLVGCQVTSSGTDAQISQSVSTKSENYESEHFVLEDSMDIEFAEHFSVDYYSGGYKMITIEGDQKFITIPQGKEIPEGLDENITAIQMPVDNTFITSTATMSLISALDAVDKVSQTTYDYDSWYIESVKEKLKSGEMSFVGEYKEPNYEMIAAKEPQLSVFTTAAYSIPDVMEKISDLGSVIIVDHSSVENNPLGRVEWIKLYGALFDMEEKAKELFDEQVDYVENIPESEEKAEDNTAAIFYINTRGEIIVRNGGDYMPTMFTMAGGEYALSDFYADESGVTNITMEEFYAQSKDAEYIIYIWSRGGEPGNVSELIEKNSLLADFKAVKEGNVWCTTPDFFQITNTIGYMISDMNSLINMDENSESELKYLFKLEE